MLDRKGKTMEEHIQTGANIFAEAEDAARKIKANFRTLRKVFEAVRDVGHIGALECQEAATTADALATQFEADVWALHRRYTLRAQELGIDLPATRDGGGGR
jgi:hypothetical protein